MYFVEVEPEANNGAENGPKSAVEFKDGQLRWTPGIIEHGKGLFRTFGNPTAKSCGKDCWIPVSETLVFRRCSGAVPPVVTDIGVIFGFDGPWRNKQWTSARTHVIAVQIGGKSAEKLECFIR